VTRALLATTVVTSVLATAGRHGAGPAVQLVRNRTASCLAAQRSRALSQGIRAGAQPRWRLLSANVVFTSTGAAQRSAAQRTVCLDSHGRCSGV
jgi:hypothetical protein